ncbi:histidine phosphatase family protein [Streptomyces sp. NPDC046805]|uniref:histidine phosphatase family protein n=1 Tax=Streptomyces sp. NPDC046805 TaxID=3155134 RepID=UPI0033F629BB
MTTYLLRHARTSYSSRYLVNGDPRLPLPLDDEGVRTCHASRHSLQAETRSCIWAVSTFPRTHQTAALLSDDPDLRPTVLPHLDELDYGTFEAGPFLEYATWLQQHGPWTRPPGASESQREGIRRMLHGVRAALDLPGPRMIVAHGLLLSVLGWDLSRGPDTAMPLFFQEAPCLAPLRYSDEHLSERITSLLSELAEPASEGNRTTPAPSPVASWVAVPGSGSAQKSGTETTCDLATVGSLSIPSEEQSPHA